MFKFIGFLLSKIVLYFQQQIKEYYYKEENTDVCFVWALDKNTINFSTNTTTGSVNNFNSIRSICGQNKLTLFGPFTPYRIILIVDLSVWFKHGFKKTYKFIKDWPGSSTVNEKELIFYQRPFRRIK